MANPVKRSALRQSRRYFKTSQDRRIFLRQMGAESGFRTGQTSSAGAQGPAQIMPATARSWGVKNPNDPDEAFGAAAKHMAGYLKAYGGSWSKALTAYNAGPGRVGQSLPAETQNYIRKILGGGDVKAGALGRAEGGGGGSGASYRPLKVTLGQKEEFDQEGFQAAEKRSVAGRLIANRRGTDNILFKTGLLTTSGPAREEFTERKLTSKVTGGEKIPGTGGGGGGKVPGKLGLDIAVAFSKKKSAYLWGGGHGKIATPNERVDCSGYVSAIVGLKTPQVSGWFARNWGKPGVGRHRTVYANDGHVLISIRDPRSGKVRWFGTSRSNPGGGPGEIPPPTKAYLSRLTPRHG